MRRDGSGSSSLHLSQRMSQRMSQRGLDSASADSVLRQGMPSTDDAPGMLLAGTASGSGRLSLSAAPMASARSSVSEGTAKRPTGRQRQFSSAI